MFTGAYPSNPLIWWESAGHGHEEAGRCRFVGEQGERRVARCTVTAEGRRLASFRRRLTPGTWALEVERAPSRVLPWDARALSFVVEDGMDREAPLGGAVREIRWDANPDTGRMLLFAFEEIVDDSPVRLEVEVIPDASEGRVARFSDALIRLRFPGGIEIDRRVGYLDPTWLQGLKDSFIAGATDDPCGTGDQVGLPFFGRAPVALRWRLVDAAGNATALEEAEIPAGPRYGALVF